jgi:hypothetical protein
MPMIQQFFAFMCEREAIRLKKEAGEPKPWTTDFIFQQYKFTNVKREDDRTTRWMREHWTDPHMDQSPSLQLFNCALFRYFGTVEFATAVGWQRGWAPAHIIGTAQAMLADKKKVFTGAYVITNGGIAKPKQVVVTEEYLAPLYQQSEELVRVARATNSWEKVANMMRRLPGFGGSGFMTKEILQDAINGTVVFPAHGPADRNTYCPAGPGARRGLNRVFGEPVDAPMTDRAALDAMLVLFNVRKEHLAYYMPELELHDIQFQLCEFDKYLRVQNGEGRPRSTYPGRV